MVAIMQGSEAGREENMGSNSAGGHAETLVAMAEHAALYVSLMPTPYRAKILWNLSAEARRLAVESLAGAQVTSLMVRDMSERIAAEIDGI
jgi:hypothetical protein